MHLYIYREQVKLKNDTSQTQKVLDLLQEITKGLLAQLANGATELQGIDPRDHSKLGLLLTILRVMNLIQFL